MVALEHLKLMEVVELLERTPTGNGFSREMHLLLVLHFLEGFPLRLPHRGAYKEHGSHCGNRV
jgi:hypothetical protein